MIRELGINKLYPIYNIMDTMETMDAVAEASPMPLGPSTTYVKYSSKYSMYKILESDSLYLFCSELSNDTLENKMLQSQSLDTYITCFHSGNVNGRNQSINLNDTYSQWMSYCNDGGASFEFYFFQDKVGQMFGDKNNDSITSQIKQEKNMFEYSLLCGNESTTSDYYDYLTFPYRVHYYNSVNASAGQTSTVELSYLNIINKLAEEHNLDINDLSPFFKHSGFIQERESRLAVVNRNNELAKCIKFIEKPDGSRVPYIIAKFGSNDNWLSPCIKLDKDQNNIFENETSIRKSIDSIDPYHRNKNFPIIIPQGRNQEQIYNIVESIVNEKEKESTFKYKIICQGHLPITTITLAPTTDRKEQKKMMEIFCQSKYWLRHVDICESCIPYNMNNVNHS